MFELYYRMIDAILFSAGLLLICLGFLVKPKGLDGVLVWKLMPVLVGLIVWFILLVKWGFIIIPQ
jgi:hypothetical protein